MEGWITTLLVLFIYAMAIWSAFDAVMKARTAQGATAWALGLLAMPFVALPLYAVFGRSKFHGYVEALRTFDARMEERFKAAREGTLKKWIVSTDEETDERKRGELRAFKDLSTFPFTRGNGFELLVDGEATFEAIFAAIDDAEDYVLAQFYIVRDDRLGRAFQERLIDAARRGVRVFLLYDEVGSYELPESYIAKLTEAGVSVSGFSGTRRWFGHLRLNFRNHRKIVVVDGRRAFVGGLNVGDEYLGRDRKLSPWRDTHLAVEGPMVQGLQFSFVRDWYYGLQETPEVNWSLTPSPKDQTGLVLASGPADRLETCGLLFAHAIESAEDRVWIASPYFVPDGRLLGALQLAALRGVDVRVLVPRRSDSVLFRYIPYVYLPEAVRSGVKVFLYEEGFMHQKVFLVDQDYAAVGTANFDNRSFLFNFEVTCLINDAVFCGEVEDMLTSDFSRSTRLTEKDYDSGSGLFHFATRLTRLLAPVL